MKTDNEIAKQIVDEKMMDFLYRHFEIDLIVENVDMLSSDAEIGARYRALKTAREIVLNRLNSIKLKASRANLSDKE